MNTPFLKCPRAALEFGHGAGARVQGLDLVLGPGTKVGTRSLCARVSLSFRGVLPTVNFFAPFAKMASADGAKWTKDNLGTQSVDKALFCTVPGN